MCVHRVPSPHNRDRRWERDPDRAFERRPTPLAPCSAWIAAARDRSSRSPARFRCAVDRVENLKLAGTGRFRSNNRDRRFESILLHHSVHRVLACLARVALDQVGRGPRIVLALQEPSRTRISPNFGCVALAGSGTKKRSQARSRAPHQAPPRYLGPVRQTTSSASSRMSNGSEPRPRDGFITKVRPAQKPVFTGPTED